LTTFERQSPAYIHMKAPPRTKDDWTPPYAYVPENMATCSILSFFAMDIVSPPSVQDMDYPLGAEAHALQHDKPLVHLNTLTDPYTGEMLGEFHMITKYARETQRGSRVPRFDPRSTMQSLINTGTVIVDDDPDTGAAHVANSFH
jgi:hypothetical protein